MSCFADGGDAVRKVFGEDAVVVGDCIEVMAQLPDACVDAIVTDPPYGLEFMGKEWDSPLKNLAGLDLESDKPHQRHNVTHWSIRNQKCSRCGHWRWSGTPCECDSPLFTKREIGMEVYQQWTTAWAAEAYRILKPGAYLLVLGGTRTHHRLGCGLEDAGFEIRDELAWIYASGFPKSHDVSKAIDKRAGAEREVVGSRGLHGWDDEKGSLRNHYGEYEGDFEKADRLTAPATPEARYWEGYGTSLKPAHESMILVQKPTRPLTLDTICGILMEEHITRIQEVSQWLRSTESVNSAVKSSRPKGLKSIGAEADIAPSDVSALPKDGANGESANNVASDSMSPKQESDTAKESSATSDARQNGNVGLQEGGTPTGEVGGLSEAMVMLPSELPLVGIGSNTMSSWRKCLVGLWSQMSKFTIGTKLEMITDLRILNSLLCRVISLITTPQDDKQINGSKFDALIVGDNFTVAARKWKRILEHIAQEPATEKQLRVTDRPIWLCKKPNEGTYVDNVLKHKVGALNIDDSRISYASEDDKESSRFGVQTDIKGGGYGSKRPSQGDVYAKNVLSSPSGRWPANVLVDCWPEEFIGGGVVLEREIRLHGPPKEGLRGPEIRWKRTGESEGDRELWTFTEEYFDDGETDEEGCTVYPYIQFVWLRRIIGGVVIEGENLSNPTDGGILGAHSKFFQLPKEEVCPKSSVKSVVKDSISGRQESVRDERVPTDVWENRNGVAPSECSCQVDTSNLSESGGAKGSEPTNIEKSGSEPTDQSQRAMKSTTRTTNEMITDSKTSKSVPKEPTSENMPQHIGRACTNVLDARHGSNPPNSTSEDTPTEQKHLADIADPVRQPISENGGLVEQGQDYPRYIVCPKPSEREDRVWLRGVASRAG